MRRVRRLLRRAGGLFGGATREAEFDDELASHLQLHVDDGIRAGLSPDEARRHALQSLGGIAVTRERWRDQRGLPFVETLARDVAYGLRILRRSKGWTAVAVLSLGLGIGLNTALFTAVDRLLLADLSVEDPGDLLALHWHGPNPTATRASGYGYWAAPGGRTSAGSFSFRAFEAMRASSPSLADLMAFAPANVGVVIAGQHERARAQFVSGTFYETLGVHARFGRTISPADEAAQAQVAVISEEFWRRRFGADPAAVGSRLSVGDLTFTVVGVTPAGLGDLFRTSGPAFDVSLPLATEPLLSVGSSRRENPSDWWLLVMGRRAGGSTAAQVEAELTPVFQAVVAGPDGPRENPARATLVVLPGRRGVYDVPPDETAGLGLVAGVFGVVLAIVAVNMANLSLFRGHSRRREFAMRLALGASRPRVIRQLLTESLLVSGLGGGLGLGLAAGSMRALQVTQPHLATFQAAPAMLVSAAGLSLLTGLASGLLPAIWTTAGLGADSGDGGRQTARSGLGRVLMAVQVALSLMLVVGAGLFLGTLTNLRRTPSGFDPANLAFFTVESRAEPEDAERAAIQERLLERLRAAPDIQAATVSSTTLLAGRETSSRITLEDGTLTGPVAMVIAHPGFFETLAIPLRAGRPFANEDYLTSSSLAVINESMARTWFGGAAAVGRTFRSGWYSSDPIRIVGVVADTKFASLREEGRPIWFGVHQRTGRPASVFYVRTRGDPLLVMPAIRQAVQAEVSLQPAIVVSSQMDAIERGYGRERAFAWASSSLGGLALLISGIGLFGLMAYSVARRTREIGIRLALGASPRRMLRSVLGETLRLVSVGLAIGLAGCVIAGRFLRSLLFGLTPNDPLTMAGAVVVLLAAAMLAVALPAWAASRVDPTVALRHE
jgi:predicted permease